MEPPPTNPAARIRGRAVVAWLALVLAVAVVYHGIGRHRFVNFDDPVYLFENGHVTPGLTADGVVWAFTNKETGLWQPSVWIAHMLVSELAGMQPAPHLMTNLLLHALNAGLLFLLLRTLTGVTGRSFVVALLFAVHPANVEAVAWASQLKSTLSTAFFLFGLLAYAREARRGGGVSFVALLALLLSLLAKPMLVSFPLLLVLMDFWPLQRLPAERGRMAGAAWGRWLVGKLPFVLLVGVIAILTVVPWDLSPEMPVVHGPEWARVAALPLNYLSYVGCFFWPAGLAVLYPERLDYPPLVEVGALLLMLVISAVVWRRRKPQPALLVGWSWFLITLVPVSGIVQLGPHGLADRYLYVPGIGLLIAAVWLVADALAGQWRGWQPVLAGFAVMISGGLAHRQVSYWENSLTLWQHAAAVTRPSYVRHVNLGNALLEAGREPEAEAEFVAAINLQGNNPRPYVNLAVIAQRRGDLAKAVALLRQARALAPADARIYSNLGSLLDDRGEKTEARALLEKAVRLRPDLLEARINLGVLLARAGNLDEAL
ncbi:MAG: tetratricopeptide repeat protein, partial [bacterium]|nr:tetratricopeptide repeat protein [bacterium]